MKKEKEKKIELIDLLKNIRTIYNDNNNSIPINQVDTVTDLFSKVEVIEKRNLNESITSTILFLIFILILSVFLYIGYKEEVNLCNEINQKNKIINGLQENNRILNYYVRGENSKKTNYYDSITHEITIRTIDGKMQSYFDLLSRVDSIDSLYIYKKIEVTEGNTKIKDLEFILNFINEAYGISVKVTPMENTKDIELIAPKLDSAIILYPFFKDKLTYNKEKNTWYIDK